MHWQFADPEDCIVLIQPILLSCKYNCITGPSGVYCTLSTQCMPYQWCTGPVLVQGIIHCTFLQWCDSRKRCVGFFLPPVMQWDHVFSRHIHVVAYACYLKSIVHLCTTVTLWLYLYTTECRNTVVCNRWNSILWIMTGLLDFYLRWIWQSVV